MATRFNNNHIRERCIHHKIDAGLLTSSTQDRAFTSGRPTRGKYDRVVTSLHMSGEQSFKCFVRKRSRNGIKKRPQNNPLCWILKIPWQDFEQIVGIENDLSARSPHPIENGSLISFQQSLELSAQHFFRSLAELIFGVLFQGVSELEPCRIFQLRNFASVTATESTNGT